MYVRCSRSLFSDYGVRHATLLEVFIILNIYSGSIYAEVLNTFSLKPYIGEYMHAPPGKIKLHGNQTPKRHQLLT